MRVVSEDPGQITLQSDLIRFRVSTAAGELLTRDEVERANTLIDYAGLVGFTIVTTGTMASDARSSYLKLKTRKPLHILDNEELSDKILDGVSGALRNCLGLLDAAAASLELLVGIAGFYLLVSDIEGARWFYVLSEDGTAAAETSDVVVSLRAARPRFVGLRYLAESTNVGGQPAVAAPRFDREEYNRKCFSEFNTVRYAALASFGFRFSSITLDELYVSASAVEGSVGEAAIARAVDDALQGLQLPDELRAQLEAEVRRNVMYGRPRESSEASRLYQRHGCVLFLGDPGSGKTCFVKHEILSYCRTSERAGWYDVHLPVYVPLSELAPLLSAEATTEEMLGHITALNAKKGFSVPREILIELSASGKVAYFFDGLDEVTSLDERARSFACIAKLVESAVASGNRIVVTSRPAATRLLEIPRHLHAVSLRGLSEQEMRTLAQRVLAARVAEGALAVEVEQTGLSGSDAALVETLINDCRNTPGLRRLAQNPLLFTLLIMIYANSGPPAAKRHRIYHQAIQTLASVRSREAGHRTFSEADLRRRLGRMAFAVVRDGTATVPRWNDSVAELRRVIAGERGVRETDVAVIEVEEFLQRVGESTGLILPHHQPGAVDGGSITFMHHSFLEYYAAAGLLAEPSAISRVIELARIPRWREVVLLCAGMLAEQGDPTELISGLLRPVSSEELFTLSNIEFAIECALEGDVPAETIHDEILGALSSSESTLRRDPELRSRIGMCLAKMFAAGRSERITTFLESGLRKTDSGLVALYLGLTATTLADEQSVPGDLTIAVDAAFEMNHSDLLIARAEALAVAQCMRSEKRIQDLRRAFKGAEPAQYAAVKACERSPEIARILWEQLREKLNEQAYFAVPAAAAILRAGWKIDPNDERNRAEVTQALKCLMQFAVPGNLDGVGSDIEFSVVDTLLTSTDPDRRVLGICLLPWVRHAEQPVHDRLLACIQKPTFTHAEKSLALGALRLSQGAQQLIKISDLDQIYSLLNAETRDVRIASAKLIGALDAEPATLQKLLEYTKRAETLGQEEFRAALRALGELRVARDGDPAETRAYVEEELFRRLEPGQRQGTDATRNLLEFLQLAMQHDRVAPQKLVTRMMGCVSDSRWSNDVRGTVLAALGWLWRPSESTLEFLIVHAERGGGEMHAARIEAVWRFTQRCKRRFDYVREVHSKLDALRDATVVLARNTPRTWQGQNDFSRVRQALEEIGAMKHAYNEYSARATRGPGSARAGGASRRP
jgi:NACHT domain